MCSSTDTKMTTAHECHEKLSAVERAEAMKNDFLASVVLPDRLNDVLVPHIGDGVSMLCMAASAGYYDLVKMLLSKKNVSADDRGPKGDCTPLMEAASSGHIDIMKLLIEHGAEVNAHSSVGAFGNTPLIYACAAGNIQAVKVLLDAGACNDLCNDNGQSPLMEAAAAGHLDVAKLLVERGAQVSYQHTDLKIGLESPMTLACYKGHVEMVKFLLNEGYKSGIVGREEELHTALMEASMDGHVEVAKVLLEAGALVNMTGESFESPLTLAACGGHMELAELLLAHGAQLNEVNEEGYTPLMEAAREGHMAIVQLLVENGAELDSITGETGETALTLAAALNFKNIVIYLVNHGADTTLGSNTPLMEAAQECNLDIVVYLLEHGADVNYVTASGETALSSAADNGATDICKLLVEYGAQVNLFGDGGRTPLMKACANGHEETVDYLLQLGANVNMTNSNRDCSPISLACANGHVRIVEKLLRHGADPNVVLKDGNNCIMEASRGGHTAVVEYLVDGLAKSNICSNYALPVKAPVAKKPVEDDNANRPQQNCVQAGAPPPLPPPPPPPPPACVDNAISNGSVDQSDLSRLVQTAPCRGGPQISDEVTLDLMMAEQQLKIVITESFNKVSQPAEAPAVSGLKSKQAELAAAVKELETLKRTQKVYEELKNVLANQKHCQRAAASLAHLAASFETSKKTVDGDAVALKSCSHDVELDANQPSACQGCPSCGSSMEVRHQHVSVVLPLSQCADGEQRPADKLALSHLNNNSGEHCNPFAPAPVSSSVVNMMISETAALIQNFSTSDADEQQQAYAFPTVGCNWTGNNNLPNGVPPPPPPPPQIAIEASAAAPQASMSIVNSVPVPATIASAASLVTDTVTTQMAASNGGDNMTVDVKCHNCQHMQPMIYHPAGVQPAQRGNGQPPVGKGGGEQARSVCDINCQTESTLDSPLIIACAGGHEELAKFLLLRGAIVEHRDKKGCTPLIAAVQGGHKRIVELLLSHRANVEAQTERRETALSIACQIGRKDLVELLLKKGSNDRHWNANGHSPLGLAALGGYVDIVDVFLKRGIEVDQRRDKKDVTPLMLASINGNAQTVKYLVELGADMNAATEPARETAFIYACRHGKVEVVKIFLDSKVNLEHRTASGLTALMEAAGGDWVEVGRLLLEAGADVNASATVTSRNTSLTIAAVRGSASFVELLLQYNANVDCRTKKGFSAVWLAASGGHVECVKLLLAVGADADMPDNRRMTPLLAAFLRGQVEVVKCLVEHVSQFPSDVEMARYITALQKRDKELMAKCEEARSIITPTKDRRALVAKEIADGLLKEIEQEQQVAETKRQAKQRRKEKNRLRKQKKREALLQATAGKESPKEEEDEEEEEEEDEEEDDEENRATACRWKGAKDAVAAGRQASSPSESSSETQSSDDKQAHVTNASPLVNQDVVNSRAQAADEADTEPKLKSEIFERKVRRRRVHRSTKVGSANAGNVGQSTRAPVEVVSNENGAFELDKSNVSDSPDESRFGAQRGSKASREDAWREVKRQPHRLMVASQAIARVIGRGGQNINAIRDASNAHIEVEKQQKSQTDRMITIKGSAEAVKMASTMITNLISDPDAHVNTIINALKNKDRKPLEQGATSVRSFVCSSSSKTTTTTTTTSSAKSASEHRKSLSAGEFPEVTLWVPTSATTGSKASGEQAAAWTSQKSPHKADSSAQATGKQQQQQHHHHHKHQKKTADNAEAKASVHRGKGRADKIGEWTASGAAKEASPAAVAASSSLPMESVHVDDGRHSAQGQTFLLNNDNQAEFVSPKSVQRPASATAAIESCWMTPGHMITYDSKEPLTQLGVSASSCYPSPIGIERKLKTSSAPVHDVPFNRTSSSACATSDAAANPPADWIKPVDTIWSIGTDNDNGAWRGDTEWSDQFASRFSADWKASKQFQQQNVFDSSAAFSYSSVLSGEGGEKSSSSSLLHRQPLLYGHGGMQHRHQTTSLPAPTALPLAKPSSTDASSLRYMAPYYSPNVMGAVGSTALMSARSGVSKPMNHQPAYVAPYGGSHVTDHHMSAQGTSSRNNMPVPPVYGMPPSHHRMPNRMPIQSAPDPWCGYGQSRYASPIIGDWNVTGSSNVGGSGVLQAPSQPGVGVQPSSASYQPPQSTGWSGWNALPM